MARLFLSPSAVVLRGRQADAPNPFRTGAQVTERLVWADRVRMGSVVSELVRNPVAAVPAGGTVRMSLDRKSLKAPKEGCLLPVPEGTHAVIASTDTGVGIQPDPLDLLVEPFDTTQPLHTATGLG